MQDSMASKMHYVEIGFACAKVCEALDRGMNTRRADQLNQSVLKAVEELTL